jgi:hypothetical protein
MSRWKPVDQPDPEVLRQQYEIERKSTRELAAFYGVSQRQLVRWMRASGIVGRPKTENKMPTPRGGTHSWGPAISKGLSVSDKTGKGNLGKRGPDAPNWKGGTKTIANGRVMLWSPEHKRYYPRAWFAWKAEHPNEEVGTGHVIHHINGDPSDDRPENLVKLTTAEHLRLHRRQEHEYIRLLQSIIDTLGGTYPPMHGME